MNLRSGSRQVGYDESSSIMLWQAIFSVSGLLTRLYPSHQPRSRRHDPRFSDHAPKNRLLVQHGISPHHKG